MCVIAEAKEPNVRHCFPQELSEDFVRGMILGIHNEYFPGKPHDYDPDEWPRKLSQKAEAILVPGGCLFGYCNDFLGRNSFISYIGHKKSCVRGAGKILHDEFLRLSRDRGMKSVRLEVLKDNYHAREFYDRLGYVVVGESRDKLLMELKLDERQDMLKSSTDK